MTTKTIRREFDAAAAESLIAQNVSRLAAQVLAARGISERAQIAPPMKTLPAPEEFQAGGEVARHLADAVKNKKHIRIIGDYDADGMTSTALATHALKRMGAQVSWRIPSRRDGYGLSEAIVQQAKKDGAQTILTVDNGVAAEDAINAAKQAGMTVLITDHHLGGECKNADAVAHPRYDKAMEGLAGVGVIFYVISALRKLINADIAMTDYLDLVALGTIADCAPMNSLNRALADAGIMQIRKYRARRGLLRLAESANCDITRINGRDIAFRIAPRINAAGRLDNVHSAMDNLLAENDTQASASAEFLEELNRKRGDMQRQTIGQVLASMPQQVPAGIVAADKEWHEGVVGIVAGILCDMHNIPAIVFTSNGKGGWKGSGRAPPNWDLHGIINTANARHPGVLESFGGHKRAVGISANENGIGEFAKVFAKVCGENRPQNGGEKIKEIDALPPFAEITPEAVAELENIVWGEGFPTPLFAARFGIAEEHPLRGGHRRMTLVAEDGEQIPAVQFNAEPTGASSISATFRLSRGWRGGIQVIIEKTLGDGQV